MSEALEHARRVARDQRRTRWKVLEALYLSGPLTDAELEKHGSGYQKQREALVDLLLVEAASGSNGARKWRVSEAGRDVYKKLKQ